MRAERLLDGPIIGPASDPSIGTNIQGPSLIRDPPIFEEDGRVFFLYAVAGEEGIALAEVVGI